MAAANDDTVKAPVNIHAEAERIASEAEADQPKVVAEIGPKPEKPAKPKLAGKIRRKADILAALKKDGLLYLDKGLYRLQDSAGEVHPVSKRRASALVKTDLLKPAAAGSTKFVSAWQFNPDAGKPESKAPEGSAE